MLSAHNAMPQEGHLEAIYYIFSYLKGHENSQIVFDHAYTNLMKDILKIVIEASFSP